ncbi:MAG: hypothetical protein J6I49_06215 [Bacteroidales bacterium]|nr:hypothetical protein [Bacteroidales bacterium]
MPRDDTRRGAFFFTKKAFKKSQTASFLPDYNRLSASDLYAIGFAPLFINQETIWRMQSIPAATTGEHVTKSTVMKNISPSGRHLFYSPSFQSLSPVT